MPSSSQILAAPLSTLRSKSTFLGQDGHYYSIKLRFSMASHPPIDV